MTGKDVEQWFTDLCEAWKAIPRQEGSWGDYYDTTAAAAWLAEARTALASVFPGGHPVLAQWEHAIAPTGKPEHVSDGTAFQGAFGVFEAARRIVASGRLSTLLEGVRAETVSELLDQADFLAKTYVVAAADGKAVTAWGGRRNDAAHKPAQFKASSEEVRAMIMGIRELVAKTT